MRCGILVDVRTLKVQALWDGEAGVWVAESDDVPGLATEAATLEELLAKLAVMVPELLEENGVALELPVELRLRGYPAPGLLLMADYAPEVKRLLREAGCYPVRQGKGDHEIWFSPITGRKFVVDSKIKSRHTANAVLKQAGLPKKF